MPAHSPTKLLLDSISSQPASAPAIELESKTFSFPFLSNFRDRGEPAVPSPLPFPPSIRIAFPISTLINLFEYKENTREWKSFFSAFNLAPRNPRRAKSIKE
jgi:hypothetical protein